MEELTFRANDQTFDGWEGVEVVRSIEALCGAFKLDVSAKTPRGRFPVAEGSRCELYVGKDLYLSGYVDAIEARLSATEHAVSVAGRDLAEDLVDCSPVVTESEYYGLGLLELARRLADPFNVEVRLQQEPAALLGPLEELLRQGWEGPPFWRFALQPGETAHDALARACQQRGFMCVSDARGVVLITRAGATRAATTIREGGQLKSARLGIDRSGRFSRYFAFGQRPGSDLAYGADAAQIQGDAQDPVPRSTRTLVLNVEANVDNATAQAIAVWNANVRAARSRNLAVVVNGWREQWTKGAVWAPNVLVPVEIPTLGVSGDWLVAGVRLVLSKDEGQVTELGLVPPDSYLPEPPRPELDSEFVDGVDEDGDAP
jgi:prophage tail gpP-like protein